MAPGGWVGLPQRGPSGSCLASPPPPTESNNQAFSYRQTLGSNWWHLAGVQPDPGLCRESSLRGWAGSSLFQCPWDLPAGLPPPPVWKEGVCQAPCPPSPVVILEAHPSLFTLERVFIGHYCVPGLCLLCFPRVAPHKEVPSQPPGDPPRSGASPSSARQLMQENGDLNGRLFSTYALSRPKSVSGALVGSSKGQERRLCVWKLL